MALSSKQIEMQLYSLTGCLRTYRDRRDQLEKVRQKVNKLLPDDIRDVNGKIKMCSQSLESGVYYYAGIRYGGTEDKILSYKQDALQSDVLLSQMLTAINREINRCDTEIGKYDQEISGKRLELDRVRMKEAAEKAVEKEKLTEGK